MPPTSAGPSVDEEEGEEEEADGSVAGIGLRSISVIIESNRSVIGFRSVNLIEFTDISVSVNYRSVSVNSVSVSVFRFTEPIYRLYN